MFTSPRAWWCEHDIDHVHITACVVIINDIDPKSDNSAAIHHIFTLSAWIINNCNRDDVYLHSARLQGLRRCVYNVCLLLTRSSSCTTWKYQCHPSTIYSVAPRVCELTYSVSDPSTDSVVFINHSRRLSQHPCYSKMVHAMSIDVEQEFDVAWTAWSRQSVSHVRD